MISDHHSLTGHHLITYLSACHLVGLAGWCRRVTEGPPLPPPPGTHVVGHVDLGPQLAPPPGLTVTRWLVVPDNTQAGDPAGTAAMYEWTHAPGTMLLSHEFRMYISIQYNSPNSTAELELGSLAISLPFDQLFMERTLEQVAIQVG